MSDLKKELQDSLDEAPWEWLKPHLDRGTLLNVGFNMDLVDVAFRIAKDDVDYIRKLMNGNFLRRPTPVQIEKWDKTPEKKFRFIIVQPYVLIQEILEKQY